MCVCVCVTGDDHSAADIQHGEPVPTSQQLQHVRGLHYHPSHRTGHAGLVLLHSLELPEVRREGGRGREKEGGWEREGGREGGRGEGGRRAVLQ